MNVAARTGLVERGHQLTHRAHLRRVGRPHQQAVGARLGNDVDARFAGRRRGASGAAAKGLADGVRQIDRHRMLQLDHRHTTGRHVDGRDDLLDARQVVGVVRDDEHVVGRKRGDGVVGCHQRPHHRQHLRRRFVRQRKHPRHQRRTVACLGRSAHIHPMQLGVGLGHDLDHARPGHGGVTLQTQRRQQDLVRQVTRHGGVGDDVQRALHARIDQEVLPGNPPDGLDDRRDVGIGKIERDGVVRARSGSNRSGGRGSRRGAQHHRDQQTGKAATQGFDRHLVIVAPGRRWPVLK